ncbi:MAG: aminoglycoside phosphotransferase family protein [Anaerolinea sp.]|nr:aminoglycoside phosphotransferase family protein [Anaerolinea sp.]
MTANMHENEVVTDAQLVRRLLAAQFPQWASLPLTPVPSAGTDNALYRLGSGMVVRLPRIDWAVGQAEKERRWLPRLAPHLPLTIPEQLAMGKPDAGYPWPWSIYRWLPGASATLERLNAPCQAAGQIARFVTALWQVDTTDGPPAAEHNWRGAPLALRDEPTRKAIAALAGVIDAGKATAVWEAALEAPAWEREPVWFHGDLLSGNVLVEQGRPSAVIDFGGLAVGDPACDLMIAWSLFSGASREVLRAETAVDEATWLRGRGCALSQAVIFIPYYWHTNPIGVKNAQRMLDELLAEYNVAD